MENKEVHIAVVVEINQGILGGINPPQEGIGDGTKGVGHGGRGYLPLVNRKNAPCRLKIKKGQSPEKYFS